MTFKLLFTNQANNKLGNLEKNLSQKKQLKAVKKALAHFEKNPHHPSLHTHKFFSQEGPYGEEIFEAYAENNTPGAYRIFWYYGPDKKHITIIDISPHP